MSQVLALKYRPASFDKLIGQETITQTLTHALDQNRLSHAYLFSGLRGSGKTSTARIFSKALVCDRGPTSKPCETCENCRMANENRHIDIIEMDAASSRKIDDIRNLIEQTKYKPNSARFKIFIIDEVHMLTKEAFNALLKTLEEPPEYVKFILATTDPMKLPPTILSRTQHFRFKKIAPAEIQKHLSHILNLEEVDYDEEALGMLTRAGNGSLRDTLTLLDQAIIYTRGYVDAKSVASMLGILDPEFIDGIFDAILKNDTERVIECVGELENYESEVVIDELIAYLKERFFERDARFSTMIADRFFRILSEAKNLLFLNADNTFVLTLLFFKMLEATKIKEIDEAIEALERDRFGAASAKTKIPPDSFEPTLFVPQTPGERKVERSDGALLYDRLVQKLYDRNYEVGSCFQNSVAFSSYEAPILTLVSCADKACRQTLRHASGIIKHFVQEIFGFDTKIEMKPCDKSPEELEETIRKEELEANKESGSMLEDIEMGSDDAGKKSSLDTQSLKETKETDPENILENPFVKKAGELFQPSRIVVKSKV